MIARNDARKSVTARGLNEENPAQMGAFFFRFVLFLAMIYSRMAIATQE